MDFIKQIALRMNPIYAPFTSDRGGWEALNPGNWDLGSGRMRNSSLGTLWDKTLGVESKLFGGKAQRKKKALSSIQKEIAGVEGRKERIFPDEMQKFNQATRSDWNTLFGRNSGSPITLATDTGKNTNFQNRINSSINNTNASLTKSINDAQNRLWSQEDQIANLRAEEQSIRNS